MQEITNYKGLELHTRYVCVQLLYSNSRAHESMLFRQYLAD